MLLGVALSLSCDVAVVTSLWTPTPPPIITAHPLKGTPVGYSVVYRVLAVVQSMMPIFELLVVSWWSLQVGGLLMVS